MAFEAGPQVSSVYIAPYGKPGDRYWHPSSEGGVAPGLRAGFSANFGVAKNFRVYTGLLLHSTGARYENHEWDRGTGKVREGFSFLEIPLHLQYHFDAYRTAHPFIGGGFGYSLLTGTRYNGNSRNTRFGTGEDLVAELVGGYQWGKTGFVKLQAGTGIKPIFSGGETRTLYRFALTGGITLF